MGVYMDVVEKFGEYKRASAAWSRAWAELTKHKASPPSVDYIYNQESWNSLDNMIESWESLLDELIHAERKASGAEQSARFDLMSVMAKNRWYRVKHNTLYWVVGWRLGGNGQDLRVFTLPDWESENPSIRDVKQSY